MEVYHVLSRGVDKRQIFNDNRDYLRFINNLFEFNDSRWVSAMANRNFAKSTDIASRHLARNRKNDKDPLVDIHAFCLMPNHFHLLLSSVTEDGIPRFMKKLNMGYAKYFNIKNDRKGTLFEGRYKSILVEEDSHLFYLPHYIHFNPLDLYMPEWRKRKLRSAKDALKFLENYKWSSFLDHIGQSNFPLVTKPDLMLEIFGGKDKYKTSVQKLLNDLNLELDTEYFLE